MHFEARWMPRAVPEQFFFSFFFFCGVATYIVPLKEQRYQGVPVHWWLLDLQGYLGGWLVSIALRVNARVQSFPADYCTEARWFV